ncbi:hypothetical protein MY4038_009252 [Beauveria bassiana]
MGFPNLTEEIGLKGNHTPSQANVAYFKAINAVPDASLHPHAARWYKHMTSYEPEFVHLPGNPSKPYNEYGPNDVISSTKLNVPSDNVEDVHLFSSDQEEDPEAVRIREQRLADYNKRKAAKPKTFAKSVVTLDVKPYDDETNMADLEAAVRNIDREGLLWGTSKLVSVGYGIKKLQINVAVEDDKVSTQHDPSCAHDSLVSDYGRR